MAANRAGSSAAATGLLHGFFTRAAARWPEQTAVEVPPGDGRLERRRVTYAELQRQADSLAACLQTVTGPDCVVAILLPRNSERLYAAQLAVLQSGAAYTCLDPAFPDEQMRDILEDCAAVAILTDGGGRARLRRVSTGAAPILDVAACLAEARAPAATPPPWLTPQSLAYIIYTSGTTGRPKGVMIEHASVANLVGGDLAEFGLGPGDRVGQNSSSAYDSSVEEIWLALASGATLVVIDDDTVRLGPDLVPWLRQERLTVFCPPPTLLRATSCADPATALPDLSLVYVGGEVLPPDVAERWAPGRRLINGYGPTECTVTATRVQVAPGQPITIGGPIPGFQAWVLNESLEEVADGQQGELCLGGIGLARGYRNRPEITAQKFPTHPRFGRIYRTGDLVQSGPDGEFFFHGRIDAQVKLRGYRIELEAIEARLIECPGVRQAACRVQGEGAQQTLVAFVVPEDPGTPPAFDDLRAALGRVLPTYMVPSHFGTLAALPTTVGGKLNRKQLPVLEIGDDHRARPAVLPRDHVEERLAAAVRAVLSLPRDVSVDEDFFRDLGGDSLRAGLLISRLREDSLTAALTVRDVYEARTVAELAKRAQAAEGGAAAADTTAAAVGPDSARRTGRPLLATLLQTLWLAGELLIGAPIAYLVAFHVLPFLTEFLGIIPLILLAPVLSFAVTIVYAPCAVLVAVLAKRLLIGRYRPLREPVWGGFYVRNWMVQQAVRVVPWRLLAGTVFQNAALRALGARIGRRVHIHRGVDLLRGGWDLLEIGDDVAIGQDAAIRLVDLDDGHVVVGPVTLGAGATVEVRAGVGPHTVLEPEAYLTALSYLPSGGRIPQGARWDGVPAKPAGQAPPTPPLPAEQRAMSPTAHGVALILSRIAVQLVLALPLELLAIAGTIAGGVDPETVLGWLFTTAVPWPVLVAAAIGVSAAVPLTLALQALVARGLGRVPVGVISRWSPEYIRVWLKAGLVDSASEWLSGALLWPVWLRWAGMRIGPGCEISSVIDVVPELVEIGPETFFADGIYLGGPRVHRSTVTLAAVRCETNTFLGNHVVIPAGQRLPADILLGICTVSDDTQVRRGTSWFGHPPFELPRREVVECDRRFTHDPPLIRYVNRVLWEVVRFGLPITPLLVLLGWIKVLAWAEAALSWPLFLLAAIPGATLAAGAVLCLVVLAVKWALLGRVRPGQHPLWSCWCSRWDFLYVAWEIYARGALSSLEGTLLIGWYLRAMGAKIGRRVVLGGGFAQVVDPDMLELEDEATVSAMFQAHTFEDRVLKIDRVKIRRRATVRSGVVLLYGADIGAGTHVAAHSVVMKQERLLPGRRYAGCPTRPEVS
jgi:non-ribosomal peptide synthetase-like protein